jgi:ribosomal protein S17
MTIRIVDRTKKYKANTVQDKRKTKTITVQHKRKTKQAWYNTSVKQKPSQQLGKALTYV